MGFFTRFISRKGFAIAMAWRIGLLIALTLGFPFLVYGFVVASGANRVGGAGGALALVLGLYLKPLIYLLFCVSLFRPTLRRSGTLGMTRALAAVVTLLALADTGFGVVMGAHWSVAFSLGIMHLQPPYFLMAAIIAITTVAILGDDPGSSASARHGWAYRVWLAALVLLTLQAAISILAGLAFFSAAERGSAGVQSYIAMMKTLQPVLALGIRQALFGLVAAASLLLIVMDRFTRPPSAWPTSPAGAR